MIKVRCPHCSDTMNLDYDDVPWTDGEEYERDCRWCNKPVVIVADVTVSHTCQIPEDYDEERGEDGE
jgi:hypothetical protein